MTLDLAEKLVADLTPEAAAPDPMTGKTHSADSVMGWDAYYRERMGWSMVYVDTESGEPLAFIGACCIGNVRYTAGLVTANLTSDKRLFLEALREWKRLLGDGPWVTAIPAKHGRTRIMHNHMGFRPLPGQPNPNYLLMEANYGS